MLTETNGDMPSDKGSDMLRGRTAVVTGGARGIGYEISRTFAKNGANLAIIDVDAIEAEKCAEAIKTEFNVSANCYECRVEQSERVAVVCESIIRDFSRVDILVNNAGITRDRLLIRMTEEDFDAVIGVNLKGAFNFTKSLARTILRSPVGRIINTSSIIGITGNVGQANYAASKAGLIGFTKSVAKEMAGRGVTCNAIAPGFIDTLMTANLPESSREAMLSAIPLKRLGTTQDVANLALFLASDMAAYITGEVINVTGGMGM